MVFLFTDIEGSTQLWERFPRAMPAALEQHDRLLRDAIELHHGRIFKTVGDAFCAVFDDALAAVSASIAGQRGLAAAAWPETGPLKTRMALHAGFATTRDGDYFGPTLNRIARLLATGHGGQTLLSEAVHRAIGTGDFVLRDLGEHRLRDLSEPERIFQLGAAGLPDEFPPLRSLEIARHNLPVQLTSFIGRERELVEARRLLENTHLLTLTGAGGTGKTRLSLQLAAEMLDAFPDGVWLAELATISETDLVAPTVAAVLSVREEAGRPITATLSRTLGAKHLLLILDNCEHLAAGCAALAEMLLRACPHLRILASSREILGIRGEMIYAIPALSMPDLWRDRFAKGGALELEKFEAVKLFVERATAVAPGFSLTDQNAKAIAQIVWRLDGIPLAIELAAARAKVLTPDQIESRLQDRFSLLTGGSRTALPRQQTLRALIDWSYDLLTPPEQALLRRLAAFARGRTLAAIEEVCVGDGIEPWDVLDLLGQLVAKSLVSMEEPESGPPRYTMLESVWDYAAERLAGSPECGRIRQAHLDYFTRMAEAAADKLRGPDQREWFDRFELEAGNFRLALEWSLESGAIQEGLRLAGVVARFWLVRSYLKLARETLSKLLARPEAAPRNAARAGALAGAAWIAWAQDDDAKAAELIDQAAEIYRELGSNRVALELRTFSGFILIAMGRIDEARQRFDEGFVEGSAMGDRRIPATALSGQGSLAAEDGDLDRAVDLKARSIALYREIGDVGVLGLLTLSLARIAQRKGDTAAAHRYFVEGLAINRDLRHHWSIPAALEGEAETSFAEGDLTFAARLLGAADFGRDRLALPQTAVERTAAESLLQKLRATLSPEQLASAREAGRALSLEELMEES